MIRQPSPSQPPPLSPPRRSTVGAPPARRPWPIRRRRRAAGHAEPAHGFGEDPGQRPARHRRPLREPAPGHRPADHQGRRRGRSRAKAGLADFTASLLDQGAAPARPSRWPATSNPSAPTSTPRRLGRHPHRPGGHHRQAAGRHGYLRRRGRRPVFAQDELERLRARTLDSLEVSLQQPGELARFAASVVVFAGAPTAMCWGHARLDQALHPRRRRRLPPGLVPPRRRHPGLTGDITPEAGFALAEKTFGDWKAPATPLPPLPTDAPQAKPRVIAIDLPGTARRRSISTCPPSAAPTRATTRCWWPTACSAAAIRRA